MMTIQSFNTLIPSLMTSAAAAYVQKLLMFGIQTLKKKEQTIGAVIMPVNSTTNLILILNAKPC